MEDYIIDIMRLWNKLEKMMKNKKIKNRLLLRKTI